MNTKAKITDWLMKYISLLLVAAVSIVICVKDYRPETYLSGWDTLHPEFNLNLYGERVFFGAWQEHQGLGAPAAQAHLSELPRLPVLWLLTTFFPQDMVRYLFFYLTYILGGIGTFVFIRYGWFETKKNSIYSWSAGIGALFYLLNLGTLQQFSVPLEMFAVHFATLGFILLFFYRILKYGRKKDYVFFFIIQFLSGPSAHTTTLFYMVTITIFVWGVFLAFALHPHKPKIALQRLMLLMVLTITANIYWIIPNFFYIINHSDYVKEAKISRLFSAEAFWQNQAYGNFKDVVILKNFLFNWKDYDFSSNKFIDLFDEWKKHLDSGFGTIASYLLSILYLGALPLLFFGKKRLMKLSFLIFLFIPFFFLVNLNFPFYTVFQELRNHSSLFEESMRFPFTKFSILFMMGLSVLLAHSSGWILNVLSHLNKKVSSALQFLFIILTSFLILYAGKPILQGNLVSSSMKIEYPDYYWELFDWFSHQPTQTRVLKFPVISYQGWNYYDWSNYTNAQQGYQGAGFIWFGIPQATIDREFDRWVPTNEYLYHELAEAIRVKDQKHFNQILEKYDIHWLYYDTAVFDPPQYPNKEFQREFETLVQNNPIITEEKSFGSITIYKVNSNQSGWVYGTDAQLISGNTNFVRTDPIFTTVGNYVGQDAPHLGFPFSGITAENLSQVQIKEGRLIFQSLNSFSGELIAPKWSSFNKGIPIQLDYTYDLPEEQLSLEFKTQYPSIQINSQIIDLNQQIASPSAKFSFLKIKPSEIIVLQMNEEFIILKNPGSAQSLDQILLPFDRRNDFKLFAAEYGKDEEGNILVHLKTLINQWSFDETLVNSMTFDGFKVQNVEEKPLIVSVPQAKVKIGNLENHLISSPQNCNQNIGEAKNEYKDNHYFFTSKDKAIACQGYSFIDTDRNQEYVVMIDSQNIQGMSLKFIINEFGNTKTYLQELLNRSGGKQFFSILGNRFDSGINVNFSSVSFGAVETKNVLKELNILPAPLTWLSNLTFSNSQSPTMYRAAQIKDVNRLNSGMYLVTVANTEKNSLLILSQSYDEGWLMLKFATSIRTYPHIKYNNWANAWLLPEGKYQVLILFWPQLAAFVGLIILLISLTLVLFFSLKEVLQLKRKNAFFNNKVLQTTRTALRGRSTF